MELMRCLFLHRSIHCKLCLFSILVFCQTGLSFGQIHPCESPTPSIINIDSDTDRDTAACDIDTNTVSSKTAPEEKVKMSSSLAIVPYDESSLPLFHKPVREFHIGRQKIVVKQNWKELGVAAVVWDAAAVLCEYLDQNQHLVDGRTIIELGAGSGIVGIIAAYLGGRVTITEREVAMGYLNSVVHDNIDVDKYNVSVTTLDWTSDLTEFPKPFQVILGADVIYIEETFDDLVKTFRHLSDEKTVIFISCKVRYERDSKFLEMMQKYFELKKVFNDKSRGILIYKAVKR
ncbi:protein N-lysine methyltransferase METTL21A-like [Liolophura sinensis]|uniref:protein N-lysine methyltransferase METTL21A-like n=1 Tax=Liolophura sinensis TaxID=3198878 RepID=UPI0031585B35